MRVLILANYAQGLFSFRREIVEGLLKNHEVTFCVPEAQSDAYVSSFIDIGASHIMCEHLSRRGTNPLEDARLLLFYLKLMKQSKPDIVFTYTIKPNVYGGIACTLLGIPYIANVTGLGTSIESGGCLQKLTLSLYRLGLSNAQKVFFQNSANRDFMIAHHVVGEKSDLLPGSGVNTSRFDIREYPPAECGTIFITVGRIMRDKGTGELLEAAKTVTQQHSDVRFQLLGSFDDIWNQQVFDAINEGIIEFIPQQLDVRPYIAKASALVHPSWHEGMSNVCLEAAAMGRPIIASDIPGCRETFDESITGIGFEPRNAQSLTDALERFLSLPWEERRDMGLAGRDKVVREFDRRIVFDKYLVEMNAVGVRSKE